MDKFVYSFSEGDPEQVDVLGEKGAVLSEMTGMGFPLPFGFTVTKQACESYFEKNLQLSKEIRKEIILNIQNLEEVTNRTFGDSDNPLLVSIRSGADISVPVIFESMNDIGLNDKTVEGLKQNTGSSEFAYRRYMEFIEHFSEKILEIDRQCLDRIREEFIAGGVHSVVSEDDYKKVIEKYKEKIIEQKGIVFPQNPEEQLLKVITAIYNNRKKELTAAARNNGEIIQKTGIPVIVQTMVFGNLDERSCSGIMFTRNPSTGENVLYGKYLVNAPDEEMIAETRAASTLSEMKDEFPEIFEELNEIAALLEKYYSEMLLVEFAVQSGRIFILETRTAKTTAKAALIGAVDMVNEGIIGINDALMRVEPEQMLLLSKDDSVSDYFMKIIEWAKREKNIIVRTNADNAAEAEEALGYGAEGIGLCRTEHMFFSNERVHVMREIILVEDDLRRRNSLKRLMNFQKADLKAIFGTMQEYPVTIRLFDAPLHGLLPQGKTEIDFLATNYEMSVQKLTEKINNLREDNPMLGMRGCRLSVFYPDILEMQVRAIIEAAIEVKKDKKINVSPEIMIPLINTEEELEVLRKKVMDTAERCIADKETDVDYKIGAMIETPRACIIADKISENAQFFSFGTNDLTQLVYGFGREDVVGVISEYLEKGILKEDPFKTLDYESVGVLIELAVKKIRRQKDNIKLAICGEQVADYRTIEFICQLGFNYVSCSPKNTPAVLVAAARNAIQTGNNIE